MITAKHLPKFEGSIAFRALAEP